MGFRDEFRLSMLKLSHDRARDFAESPWLPWPVLAAYRGILAVYCIGWIIYSGFFPGNRQEKWFIYLTNWGYSFVTVYFILSFTVTLYYHLKEKDQYNMPPMELTTTGTSANLPDQTKREGTGSDFNEDVPSKGHHKAMWVIYEIGATIALEITLLYWILLSAEFDYTGVYLALDISVHALNTVFMLFEVVITSVPVRVLHVIYPVSFAVIYMLFSVIYWAAGGPNTVIYPILDYSKNPGFSVGLCLGAAFIATPLVHVFVVYGLYWLRQLVVRKCSRD